MNLGDGLVFELENGKPRLVVSNHTHELRSTKKAFTITRPQKVLYSSDSYYDNPVSEKPQKTERVAIGSGRRSMSQGAAMRHEHPRGTKALGRAGIKVTSVSSKGTPQASRPAKAQSTKAALRQGQEPAREMQKMSLVCLTQEQLQQILSTINHGSGTNSQSQPQSALENSGHSGTVTPAERADSDGTCHKPQSAHNDESENTLEKGDTGDDGLNLDRPLHDLFSTLGERERKKEVLDARKEQWKKELDEQVALKQQQKVCAEERDPWGQRHTQAAAHTPKEAVSMEHVVSTQELEQQRKEARERRLQEQQYHPQRRPLSQLPSPGEEAGLEAQSICSASYQLSSPVTSSVAQDGTGTLEGDPLGRVSVGQRTSHLRTMTALLDPAQIEERERKRLKQLEHQRAIAAQVEEKQRQREKEAALRQQEEQQEEQRVAQERERLEQQYQLDMLQQRLKEEAQTRKREEVYLSVRKAEEEALRSRHQQRVRNLARNGHNISKLVQSLEGGPDAASCSSRAAGDGLCVTAESATVSPGRDTAVQTDVETPAPPSPVRDQGSLFETVDVTAEYKPPPAVKKAFDRGRKGKKNVQLVDKGGGAHRGFAETEGRQPQTKARPAWNCRRPTKVFVPASDRYPAGVQPRRPERQAHRQADTLSLVGKGGIIGPGSRETAKTQSSPRGSKVERAQRSTRAAQTENGAQSDGLQPSDPVERPPSSSFVPYVRTDEAYHLDPLAPISRPPTQELQHKALPGVEHSQPTSSPPQRDPLLNPDLLKNKERQQAILRGLSELRQGLLLKQKELESGFNLLLLGQDAQVPHVLPYTAKPSPRSAAGSHT